MNHRERLKQNGEELRKTLEEKFRGKCEHLKQVPCVFPLYCTYKEYCEDKFFYAGNIYCKKLLRKMK